jgi:hypothetical protein
MHNRHGYPGAKTEESGRQSLARPHDKSMIWAGRDAKDEAKWKGMSEPEVIRVDDECNKHGENR